MSKITAVAEALKYLNQPVDCFWKWTDDGGAIQWYDGATIVFTAELLAILRHQYASGTRGLPPLGAVILLVAATRENWSHDVTGNINPQRRNWLLDAAGSRNAATQIELVLNKLSDIRALDGDVRLSLEAKQWITEIVFGPSPRTSVETAEEVLLYLSRVDEVFWNRTSNATVEETLRESVSVLQGRLDDVTPERLRLLRETGIEEIPTVPEEPELEFPEYDSIKSLVRDLQSDAELFGIARATKQLMSVMSLPRPMLQDDQMEQGGFSDIANRGSLDRLLLSELAYDDMTLAVRVAVNEAMYLRREIPPSESQRRRVFLLDSGLRMWGVPRFLGTSVALALAGQLQSKTDRETTPFTAFIANGDELQKIDLGQRAGIASHLKMLRPELDPSDSFPSLERSLDDFVEAPEVVIITSPEALSDVNFRDGIAAMARQNPGSYFVVTVSRDGETRLNEITRSGCKPIQKLKFDLERVFSNPPIRDAKPKSQLPAIFGVKQFPLLLSYHFKQRSHVWPLGTEMMLAITNDSRLMLSFGSDTGAVQLLPNIKQGTHWWSSRAPIDSVWFSIIGTIQSKEKHQFRLLCFHQEDWSIEEIGLELPEQPRGFCSHGDTIFCIGKNYISMIDKSTGRTSLNLLSIGDKAHLRGRYFASSKHGVRSLFALASDGLAPKFELLPKGSISHQNGRLFDSTEVEGTVGVFDTGHLYFWATGKLLKIRHGFGNRVAIDDICHTGNTLILRDSDTNERVQVDVKTGVPQKSLPVSADFRQLQMNRLIGEKPLRTQFLSIGIHDGEYLALASRKKLRIDIRLINDQVCLAPTPEKGLQHSRVNFEAARCAIPARFRLKVARWKDGSEAWLDSRGLLHLKSSDHQIPEMTIVLTDHPMGGWLSTGQLWGNPFFLPAWNDNETTNDHAMDIIKKFTINIVNRC